ncbi:acylphosphatase, partial [Erwinia amylovora]|uniref:acylphosphatase n=1 Tax=Erwinia amylovora TaxID=552 RepID=UPI0020BEF11F
MTIISSSVGVHGRVQGVGYRYSTRVEAQKKYLCCYAKNRDDVSVEIVACGEAPRVEALMAWLKAG